MNFIPKITYTELGTGTAKTITFDSPPERDPLNESFRSFKKSRRSTNGTLSTQWNYNKRIYKIDFRFQSSATWTKVYDLWNLHTSRGGEFEYFIHSDEITSSTFVLTNDPTPKRPINDSAGDFEYDFTLNLEQVI